MSLALTSRRAVLSPGQWVRNELWRRAKAVPSLDLRFADNKSLVDATTGQNLVTFTRASSGTYVGSDGLIKTATTNLLLRSEEFDNASWAKTNLSVTANQIEAPNGTLTADKLVENTANSNHYLEQPITVADSVSVTGSCYLKKAERSYARIRINNKTGGGGRVWFDLTSGTQTAIDVGYTATITPVGNDWYRCTLTEPNIGSGGSAVSLQVFTQSTSGSQITYTGDGTSGIYLWGAQLEQSSTVGEYIPTTSTINSAPRFDHDPTTGESLGLLVEESRTNYATQSQIFSGWTVQQLVQSTASVTAPDGSSSAQLFTEDTTNNTHRVFLSPTTGQTTHTHSVYVKNAAGTRNVYLSSDDSSGIRQFIYFNLQTGVLEVNTGGWVNPFIVPYPNGWYKIGGTIVDNGGSTLLLLGLSNVTNGVYLGDGSSGIYIWGAQLEAGAFPTSYIPTTTATVTRSADVASITGTNFSSWYRQDEGTLYGETATRLGISQGIASVTEGAFTNNFRLRKNNSNQYAGILRDGSTRDITVSPSPALVENQIVKLAIAVKQNDCAATGGGQAVATRTTYSLATMVNLFIGGSSALGDVLANAPISRLTFWPQRLSNSQLQTITQS